MNKSELKKGFEELDHLAFEEYHKSLEDLLRDKNDRRRRARLARLTGILMKRPFADPTYHGTQGSRTGAYRRWELKDSQEFAKAGLRNRESLQLLERIRKELSSKNDQAAGASTVFKFAEDARDETGFFGYFSKVLRDYICGDPEIRKKVKEILKKHAKLPEITPETIVAAGGLTLGGYLVSVIPVLAFAGAPIVAAVVLILYTIGVDAFCKWTNELQTNEEEK